MIDIGKYVQYCMGRGYVDKRSLARDTAFDKAQQRVTNDLVDNMMRGAQLAEGRQATQKAFFNLPIIIPPNPTLFQNLGLALMRPAMMLAQFFQNLKQLPIPLPVFVTGAAAQVGQFLEKAVSNILTFFFGFKKDNTEEKKKREEKEIPDLDLFTKFTVHESQGASTGGDQR